MHQISNFHRVFMYFNNEKITIKELLTIDLNTKAKNLNIYITTTCI